MRTAYFVLLLTSLLFSSTEANGALPLSQQIDKAISGKVEGPVAAKSTDAEFLRRIWFDLAGSIPTSTEARAFLNDSSPNKRQKLIDQLLNSPVFAKRMQHVFSIMLLERRQGTTVAMEDWEEYLRTSFEKNKPLNQLVQELLSADGTNSDTRSAMKFFLSRSATDHKLLALDVGRLLLGRNLECAQCHDHPAIKDYKQSEFFGVVAFLNRSYLYQDKKTKEKFYAEKGIADKVEFTSVFTSQTAKTGPKLLEAAEIDVPVFEKGKELSAEATEGKPPIPKFPLRSRLANQMTASTNLAFSNNLSNRLWAMMMGRGLVEPLDMQHSQNPSSHPELSIILADSLAANKYDLRKFLREIALSETYQRASQLDTDANKIKSASFAVFNMKSLSAEQLAYAVMRSTGVLEKVLTVPADKDATKKYRPEKGHEMPAENLDNVFKMFRSIYAAQAGQPEGDFNPSLAAALFIANEKLLLKWLEPVDGNLMDRLLTQKDASQTAEELYLSILTRQPTTEETSAVAEYLKSNPDGKQTALTEMAWALLASAEFRLNH